MSDNELVNDSYEELPNMLNDGRDFFEAVLGGMLKYYSEEEESLDSSSDEDKECDCIVDSSLDDEDEELNSPYLVSGDQSNNDKDSDNEESDLIVNGGDYYEEYNVTKEDEDNSTEESDLLVNEEDLDDISKEMENIKNILGGMLQNL